MGKKLKSATNNQWVSTTVDPNMVPAKDRQPKTQEIINGHQLLKIQ